MLKYHYVRLEIQCGIVELTHVPTDNNVADVFTKPVTRVRLDRLISCVKPSLCLSGGVRYKHLCTGS